MSKQATLTSFFHARKAVSDGSDAHVVKKRKLELESKDGKVLSTNTKLMRLNFCFFFQFSVRICEIALYHYYLLEVSNYKR